MQLSARRILSDKTWWRNEVLLEIERPPLLGEDLCDERSTQLQGLLQCAAQMGIGGIWLTPSGLPDQPPQRPATPCHATDNWGTQPDALAQTASSMGLRTLRTRMPGSSNGRRSTMEPGRPGVLRGPQDNACEIHAQLCCHLKASSQKWPLWHLPAPDVLATASLRQCYSTVALQLSVRGTPVLRSSDVEHLQHLQHPAPAHGPANRGGMLEAYAHMVRWRKNYAALVYGTMKLLPVHAQLLCFIREHQGQRILCVFNWSERYVRAPLTATGFRVPLIPGSLLEGGRIVNDHIDCDPWGGFFAALNT